MRTWVARHPTPWFVGAAACLLYLATLSNHYTGDGIEYALAIERADLALLLDPYHPLLHPAGLLFYRIWQLAGGPGRALLPLQVLNALAGGLCAGLLTGIARVLSQSAARAALVGVGFAVSGGLWMLSVEAEFVRVVGYFFGHGSYGRLVPFNLLHGAYAFLRSVALYPNLSLQGTTRQFLGRASAGGRFLFARYYGLIGLLVLATVEAKGLQLAEVWATVLLLGVANASFEVLPHHDIRRNDAYHMAQQVIAHTSSEETILVRSDDIVGLYLAHWSDRQVVYSYPEAESWAEIPSWVEERQDAPPVLVVDSD